MRNNVADDTVSNTTETNTRPIESNYLEPAPMIVRQRISSSGGPLSPSSPPPPLPPMSTNNNCEFKCVYTNFPLTPTSTINFDNLRYLLNSACFNPRSAERTMGIWGLLGHYAV